MMHFVTVVDRAELWSNTEKRALLSPKRLRERTESSVS